MSLKAELSDRRARETAAEAAEAVTSFFCFFSSRLLGFLEASCIPLLLLPSFTFRKQVLADEMVQPGKSACG